MYRRTFLSLASATAAFARQQPPDDAEPIRFDVNRVNLLFTVSDRRGRFIKNLQKGDFEVMEGKRRQTIIEFAAETNLPLRIALLVDTSNSIRDRFRFELEAAAQFLQGVIRKDLDRALVYSFDSESRMVQDLTDDTGLLAKKVRELRPGGGTAMYEAIYLACRDRLMAEAKLQRFRSALIVIGDGEDNASRYSRDQTLEMVQKSDAVVYAISTNTTRIESDGDKVLKYFASETGGLAFFPFKAEDLSQDFENIANELRSQYSVLYRPEPLVNDGLYHDVTVSVKAKKSLVVRARKGYYAPKR
ncbi:MAG: VWA domain-containing protein [Bryobacterales bacterium]|nr:VWA domain-containing protein [Bryobacterales bacterium]